MWRKDYSYINNHEDLKKEIAAVKVRLRHNRLELEQRWHRLPAETIRATAGSFIPTLLDNNIASGAWNFIKSGVGYIFARKNSSEKKKEMKNSLGKLGFYTLVNSIFSGVKKKKREKEFEYE